MPQMMPIYWLMIFNLNLFSFMIMLSMFNTYFIIKLYNNKFNSIKINNTKSKKFIFKWK